MSKFSYKSLFIIFFFLLIGVVILSRFVLPNKKVSASWWNESWSYRKAISLTNSSGSNLTDFQVSISIGTSALIASGKMQSDCDDIRITDINGNLLPFWIEENNPGCNQLTDTKIWLKASSIPTSGGLIYFYYGNSQADNIEDGKNVFLEFDDFNNQNTISNWIPESNPNTTYNISGGTMSAIASSGDYSSAVFGSNYTDVIINSRYKVNSSQTHGGFVFRAQTTAADNSYQWLLRRSSSDNRIQRRTGGGQYYLLGGTGGEVLPSTLSAGNWYPVEFRLSGTEVDTYFDNQQAIDGNFADTTYNSGKVGFLSYDGTENYDYIFIRQYASSQPTSSIQSEELSPAPIAYWKFDNNEFVSGYTPLNYVTINNDISNGYFNSINTGVLYNSATKLEFTAKSTDTTSNIVLVSGYSSASSRAYPCILGGDIAASSFTTATLTPSGVTRAQFSDGTTRTFTLNYTSSSTDPISFGSWSDSSWSRTVDWYSFKIWNNNTLVRNFIPAKRNSDNAIGFYDTVNNVLYTNAGAGNFTAGNEITYDSISNQNNGILGVGNSTPTWIDESQCISGKCLQFSGNDYVSNINTSLPNVGASANLTISAWIKPSNTTGTIFTKGASGNCFNYGLRISGGNLLARNTSGDYNLGGNITTDNWQHITIVYSDSGSQGYINGKPINNNGSGVTSSCNSNQWVVGARAYNALNSENFNGLIDEIKIYPYARTADQIKQDYNSRGSTKGSSVNLGVKSNTAPSLKSKLVAYWKFDEGNGSTVYDSSGNNLSGTFIGAGSSSPSWTNDGKKNKGLSFGGDVQSLFVPNSISIGLTNNFSISTWVYPREYPSGGVFKVLMGKVSTWTNGYALGSNNGNFQILVTNGVGYTIASDTSSYSLNKWYFLTATYNNSILRFYVNGVLKDQQTVPTIVSSSNDFYVGGANGASNRGFNSIIDEIKIYNTALTAEEVKQDYNAGAAIQFGSTNQTIGGTTTSLEYCIPGDTSHCAPPVAEWKLDEKIGTSIVDTSGNNNTGTINGATWTQGKIGSGLKFSTVNDYVYMSTLNNFYGSGTVSMWVKWTGSGFDYLFDHNEHDFLVFTNDTGFNFFPNYGADSTDSLVINNITWDQNWHFVTFTADDATNLLQIYFDGILKGSSSPDWSAATVNNFTLGAISSYRASYNFNGSMDHVKIYNYVRTPAQIAYDYNKGAPVGWWKLDECQGNTAYDWSGIGNTGIIIIGASGSQNSLGTCQVGTSAAWTNGASGKTNSSLNFDGTDDYINLGNNNIGTTNSITVSVWAKPNTISGAQTVISKAQGAGYGIELGVSSANKWSWAPHINGSYRIILSDNNANTQWTNLIGTYDGSTVKFYVNGILQSNTISTSGGITVSAVNLLIGQNPPTDGSFFSGQIDDVRIYNYALTSEQVKQLYNGGAASFR